MAPTCFPLFLAIFLFVMLCQPFFSLSRNSKSGAQPFNFLRNMEHAQKGQTVTGLNEVKNYLRRFGYYPRDSILNDDFDDVLESAVKTYQNYYSLNITGKLDSDTMKHLATPRCGLPDITNITFTKPIKGKNMLVNISNYAFINGFPRWRPSKYQLTYTFNSGVPEEEIMSVEEIKSAFSQAFQSWEGVSQFKFQEVRDGSTADIVVGFFRGDHGDGEPFDGPEMVLAHSFPPEDGRSHYDADENWSSNPDSNQFDLQSVVVHELGHVLGLGHSQYPEAIMYPRIPPGTIKRQLTQDDIQGIQALYSNN